MKKLFILLLVALLLTGALAQDNATVDTRLSILENRVTRLESDLSRLSGVPTQLARIEEKITALTDRASNNSGVLQTVGLGVVMSVITGWASFLMGKRTK